ncbi:mCG147090 [Mus musculus]|nr:mCG147090 [Mus musculus]
MSSSESHTVQAVSVSVTGPTVGGLMLCFTISVLNPVFLHAVCQKPKQTNNNNKKNTSYGIEGNSPCCQGKPFPYLLNITKSVLASFFIMLLSLKMRNSPLRLQSTHLDHWSGILRRWPALSLVGEVGSSSGRLSSHMLCTQPPSALQKQSQA